MTTTIKLMTHDWPVEMVTTDDYSNDVITHHGITSEVVPPNSERLVHITSTRRISFTELPLPERVAAVDNKE